MECGIPLRRPKGRRRVPMCSWGRTASTGGGSGARGRRNRRRRRAGRLLGTGVVETVAREHGEGHAMALRVPGVAVKLMATVVWPLDGRSLVGDELVRRRVRVSFVRWLQSSREREERMGRWPCSRRLRRSRRRGRRRAVAVATAEGISDGERRRRGR